MSKPKYDLAERYRFLIEFGFQHPLALGAKGHQELRRLKAKMTGLSDAAAARAVAEDRRDYRLAQKLGSICG